MEFPNNVFIVYSLIINRSILRYVRMPADKEKHFLIPQVQFLTKVRPRESMNICKYMVTFPEEGY